MEVQHCQGKNFLSPIAFHNFTGMKMKFFILPLAVAATTILTVVSCGKEPAEVEPESTDITVTGKIKPTYGGTDIQLDSVIMLSNGVKIKVTNLKFYFTDVRLGGTSMIDYSLYDFRERGTAWFQKTGTFSLSNALTYNIGVGPEANHADPTICPTNSWLYITNANDMHWSWNQGYIFINIEGKADTIVDGTDNFDLSFSYHLGDNHLYTSDQQLTVNAMQTGSKQYDLTLRFDFQRFFENETRPIDLTTEYITHSSPDDEDLSEKVRLNFAEAFSPYE